VTDTGEFKALVRKRMAATGEKYTEAYRALLDAAASAVLPSGHRILPRIAVRYADKPAKPVYVRLHLWDMLDLSLDDAELAEYLTADEDGRLDLVRQWLADLCVPKTSSTSCDQAIFVDQATDARAFSYAVLVEAGRLRQRFQGGGCVQGAVRPVQIVMGLVLAQDPLQMILVPDEGTVQELTAASPDPAFSDRVHPGRPDVAAHGPDVGVGEDGAGGGGEVRSAVADHELDPISLFAEVHEQVPGLLGGPLSCGMRRDAGDPDAPGRVFYHSQDVGLGAAGQVNREEVAREDGAGLGAQELRPGRPGAGRDLCR